MLTNCLKHLNFKGTLQKKGNPTAFVLPHFVFILI